MSPVCLHLCLQHPFSPCILVQLPAPLTMTLAQSPCFVPSFFKLHAPISLQPGVLTVYCRCPIPCPLHAASCSLFFPCQDEFRPATLPTITTLESATQSSVTVASAIPRFQIEGAGPALAENDAVPAVLAAPSTGRPQTVPAGPAPLEKESL